MPSHSTVVSPNTAMSVTQSAVLVPAVATAGSGDTSDALSAGTDSTGVVDNSATPPLPLSPTEFTLAAPISPVAPVSASIAITDVTDSGDTWDALAGGIDATGPNADSATASLSRLPTMANAAPVSLVAPMPATFAIANPTGSDDTAGARRRGRRR